MWTVSPADALLTLPAASVALAVRVCAPGNRALLVMDQLPLPSAVAVPSNVEPSVSYRLTVLPASAVPVKVGVVLLVMSSLLDTPVSLAAARSGAEGAAGARVSKVSVGVAPAPPLFPAVSVYSPAATVMLAVPPLVAAAGVNVAVRVRPVPLRGPRVPPETVTSPKVNVAPGFSLKAKVMSAVSPILSVDTLLLIPNVGAVVSMVTGKPADAALTLPAVSVALAFRVCAPGNRALLGMDQLPLPSAVAVPSNV